MPPKIKNKAEMTTLNMLISKKDKSSVKKATLDFEVGFRDILILGLKTLKSSKKSCKATSSHQANENT